MTEIENLTPFHDLPSGGLLVVGKMPWHPEELALWNRVNPKGQRDYAVIIDAALLDTFVAEKVKEERERTIKECASRCFSSQCGHGAHTGAQEAKGRVLDLLDRPPLSLEELRAEGHSLGCCCSHCRQARKAALTPSSPGGDLVQPRGADAESQCDHPSAELAAIKKSLRTSYVSLFMDGRNEHGTHLLEGSGSSILEIEAVLEALHPLDNTAEEVFAEAEKAGHAEGHIIVTRWRFIQGEHGHYEFDCIDHLLTSAMHGTAEEQSRKIAEYDASSPASGDRTVFAPRKTVVEPNPSSPGGEP